MERMIKFLVFCIVMNMIRRINAEDTYTVNSKIYTRSGHTSSIQCPINDMNQRNLNITSIRWTKWPKLTFVAHYYLGEGHAFSRNARFYIDVATITTLYINNTMFADEGKYQCIVRGLNSQVTRQIVSLFVYEGYSLDLSEKGKNASNPISINVTVGSKMSILCIAILTRPLLRLAWDMKSQTSDGQEGRIQQRDSNEKVGDKHIITRELYLEKTYVTDTGLYTCLGYYNGIQEGNSNRSVVLVVQNKTTTEIDALYQKPKEGIIIATVVTVSLVVILALFAVAAAVYKLPKKTACPSDKTQANETKGDEESSTAGNLGNTQDGETTENHPFINGSNSTTLQPNNAIEKSMEAYATKEELIQNKQTFPCDPLEFDYCLLRFYDNGFLGRGEFGFVRKAVAPYIHGENGVIQVAVKCLKEDASSEDKDNFLRELEIMKLLRSSHPNVVKLLGYCTSSDPICIIVELSTHGSLHGYLLKNRCHGSYQNIHPQSRDLTSSDLLQFAWQIAKGMSFIDSKLFIHRDLAARNILLCDNMCCKISDFGFAHDVSATGVYKFTAQGRLPIRWMAIESLINSISTIKSDVWSYGVVLWELVTLGSTPYAQFGPRWVIQKLRTGYRLPKPRHCSDELYQIMSQCWLQDADRRPSFSELCKTIGEIAIDVNENTCG